MKRAAQLLAVLCVVALVATLATAGGKKPPGGKPGDTGGGTIYFSFGGQVWSMNSAGSAKTPLPVYPGEMAEPSRQLHNGQRWFLTLQEVGTYGPRPDGSPAARPRYELFAVSEDGITEPQQLTFSESLEELTWPWADRVRWTFDDSRVSWVARSWDDPETGSIVEGGVYSLEIDFSDGTPQPIGLPALVAPGDLINFDEYWGTMPGICGHDWSPDGTSIVHNQCVNDVSVLSIVDAADPSMSWDLTEGWAPEWSPDGATIAFRCVRDDDPYLRAIYAMGVDGSDRRSVFSDTEKPQNGIQAEWHYLPSWSPAGTHLACYRQTYDTLRSLYFGDVLRATADGGDRANLTRDLDTKRYELYAVLAGWR